MIKPDCIIAQPKHVDYPLFRYNIRRYREYFNKVFIAFTQDTMPEPHYAEFSVQNFPDVTFIAPPKEIGDWRSVAVRDVLHNFVKSSKILFLEQDFLMKDERLLEVVLNQVGVPFTYYEEGGRAHPAFALVDTDLVMKTSLDFSANPPVYDHFGLFFKEIKAMNVGVNIEDLDLLPDVDFTHIAGLTQNYYCYLNEQPLYRPNRFLTYNHLSIKLPVPQHPEWMRMMKGIDDYYAFEESEMDEPMATFFPKGDTNA